MNSRTDRSLFLMRWCVLALMPLGMATAADQDQWPLLFTANGEEVQVFTPQPESFDGTSFTMRAAVAAQADDGPGAGLGAVWGEGMLEVDRDSRMGELTTFTVTDARMRDECGGTGALQGNAICGDTEAYRTALHRLDAISALENEEQHGDAYVNDPPTIVYRETPAVLVFVDGAPVYEKVERFHDGRR